MQPNRLDLGQPYRQNGDFTQSLSRNYGKMATLCDSSVERRTASMKAPVRFPVVQNIPVHDVHTHSGDVTARLSVVKPEELEAHHLLPLRAYLEKGRRYTSTPLCLHSIILD
jgi:hypothetical protein